MVAPIYYKHKTGRNELKNVLRRLICNLSQKREKHAQSVKTSTPFSKLNVQIRVVCLNFPKRETVSARICFKIVMQCNSGTKSSPT